MSNFILNRQYNIFGQVCQKRVEKILYMVNNPRIPSEKLTYHEIHVLKKGNYLRRF